MTVKPLLLGALSISAVAALAGCGGSSAPTPTASTGLTIPNIPGLPTLPGSGTGTTGAAPAADTLLKVSAVQTISGDPNVSAVSGTCSSLTCVYSDTTSSGGGGGIVFVEPFPGGLGQAALQTAVTAALSSGTGSSGGTVTAVTGLGTAAIKEIDANSATYAFSKDNYLVVINITSTTNSGTEMDSQVQAAAQTAAGQL